jgi:hypothetical protein
MSDQQSAVSRQPSAVSRQPNSQTAINMVWLTAESS